MQEIAPDGAVLEGWPGALAHRPAIERVVQLMQTRLHESLALGDLADEAHLSPFYFCRVFRQITGSPPGEFLAALRLSMAKRLLLTTSMSVTEICYEVGYVSLGSFSTRFHRSVGLAPADLRRLSAEPSPARIAGIGRQPRPTHGAIVNGRVDASGAITGPICVGLFGRPIPQGPPLACTMLMQPGGFRIGPVPDGRYYALAAALPWSDDPLSYLLPGAGLLVACAPGPVLVARGHVRGLTNLLLQPPRPIDPPIVVALPLLQARYQFAGTRSSTYDG